MLPPRQDCCSIAYSTTGITLRLHDLDPGFRQHAAGERGAINMTCIPVGARASRTLLFPLVFLFWMVPIPSVALNKVVEFLQAESAVAARLIFSLIGVPVSQQGVVLSIPGVNIEVARECSSIRSSVMLLVASMVLAQVSLRSPWSKAAVIAATVPLSIAKNALRIVTLSMLGTRVDPGFLTGRLHHR